MKDILDIISQLESTSSRIEKEKIITENADNEKFLAVLYYTYSDNLQYGFSEKKLRELLANFVPTNDIVTWAEEFGFNMLDVLAENNINDNLRNSVLAFLTNQPEDERELWVRILTKDLRCNISTKTINKCVKGLISTWEIQQAYPIQKAKLKKDEWIALSLKLNGIRTSFFKNTFRSRQNKEMLGYNHIKSDIESIESLKGYMIDGELIRKNIDGVSDNENFRLTTSIVNSDVPTKLEIEMVIFDLVPNDEFIKGQSSRTFKERLEQLRQLQAEIDQKGLKNIRIAPTFYTGTDHSMIQKLLDKVDAEGYEGLMCLRDEVYKCKRHKGILKVKKFKSADCTIVGYEEGDGKYKGVLGSFIIDYKGNHVNVGSGYTDEQRKDFWENRDNYIGRVLEVKFKEESMDSKTKLISLQFPIFICIREQGKEISYN